MKQAPEIVKKVSTVSSLRRRRDPPKMLFSRIKLFYAQFHAQVDLVLHCGDALHRVALKSSRPMPLFSPFRTGRGIPSCAASLRSAELDASPSLCYCNT